MTLDNDIAVPQPATGGHMKTPFAVELRQRLDAACSEVTFAESALETALRELGSGPRAEKIAVTAVVSDAFARLRLAHAELLRLRDMVDGE